MSGWIEHDGTCCPVPVGVRAWFRDGRGREANATIGPEAHMRFPNGYDGNAFFWDTLRPSEWSDRIIAYRLPRSRAAEDLIERIRNLEPEKEPA